MQRIKDFFDDFTFHARVMPIVVLLMPIIAIGIIKGILQDSWFESTIIVALGLCFLSITSKIARNLGKEYEKRIYKQLGGMPSTIILRFSDDTLDDITKQRYHNKLNHFQGLTLPINKASETAADDQQYRSASNILRNYANSNRDKEPRVYQELKEYNFWRNLYGTKRIALFIYFIIAFREYLVTECFSLKDAFLQPYPDYICLIIMIICITVLIFFVNQKSVVQKGFDYATALIEVCERIPEDIA